MSGQNIRTYNNQSRREFLKKTALALPWLASALSCHQNEPRAVFKNDNSGKGHRLQEGFTAQVREKRETDILIVGGGISGLTTAHYLQKLGITNFVLLDAAPETGGNAIASSNHVSAYPWAAHYLPIVNNANTPLLEFLHEHTIITGYNAEGLPVYNEYYLCFEPEDRLFINGHWQSGLIPDFGVPDADKKQIAAFLKLVDKLRAETGSDGKYAFDIPLSNASQDTQYAVLDALPFSDYLQQNGFTSEYLLWYLNYCCRDDYGSELAETSAYAGLHYFCARRAKAANAPPSAILTWPQGNAFLAELLRRNCAHKIKTNALVRQVELRNNKVVVVSEEGDNNNQIEYTCNKVVMACPHYVCEKLLSDNIKRRRPVSRKHDYSPWIVANITLKALSTYGGEELSWDNVIYKSASLGYVNACHQSIDRSKNGLVITYYLPLSHLPAKTARQNLRKKDLAAIAKEIRADLKKAHNNIDNEIEHIGIKLWGHGMIKPLPGFIKDANAGSYAQAVDNALYFVHSDVSGISIFEEAFAQGYKTAQEIKHRYAENSKT